MTGTAVALLTAAWSPALSHAQDASSLDDHFEELIRLDEAEAAAEEEADAEATEEGGCVSSRRDEDAGAEAEEESEEAAPEDETEDAGEEDAEEDLAAEEEEEEEGLPDCEDIDKPIARSVKADAKLATAGKHVVASGTVRKRGVRSVRLTVYRSDRGGRWRKVDTRTVPVRKGRFSARVARRRKGSEYRVVVSPVSKKGKARRGLSNASGSSGAASAPVRAEARLLDVPAPGPLPGGGVIAAGTAAERKVVRALQARLTVAGLPTRITGTFDGSTAAAVTRFQSAHGLQVDGIVGRQTATALAVYG